MLQGTCVPGLPSLLLHVADVRVARGVHNSLHERDAAG